MKLFYHRDPIGNFGDDLNPWLWPRLIPELLDDNPAALFVGIGTILDERIPDEPRKVVFGTGVGYGRLPALDERWKICCVRGPLTARALGLPPDLAGTDPAVLVRTVVPYGGTPLYPVSFMPHHRTKIRAAEQGLSLEEICIEAGVNYIDPAWQVEEVIRAISRSHLLIAEAMHGAIVADALRVHWIPVQLYDHIRALKWQDWCLSVGLEYEPEVYPVALGEDSSGGLGRFISQVMKYGQPMLSTEGTIDGLVARLQERLDALRADPQGDCCVTGGPHFVPDPEVLRSVPWLYEMQLAVRELAALVPVGESFILVNQDEWGEGQVLAGRRAIPFMEKKGRYWGPPRNDRAAIQELERLRASGASLIAFASSAFWWLDFYSGLHSHLRSNYRLLLESEYLVAFALDLPRCI
jgi:hypothetical protein